MNEEKKDNHKPITVDNIAGYDRWSSFYDSYPNPTVAADDTAFPAFWGELRGLDILEIGCGTGRHTVRLAEHNHVTGIDISAGMLAQARAKMPDGVRLIEGDFITCPALADGAFDVAVASLVLEHIGDPGLFFTRLALKLRRGGRFLMSEIHPARTADGVFAHFRDKDAEYHLTSYPHTQAAIMRAAAQAGFTATRQVDVAGDSLAALNPKWTKYAAQPMIRMWDFHMRKFHSEQG